MNRTLTFLIGILLGAILGVVTMQKVDNKPSKEYVYVDIDKIISAIAQDVANSSVPQEALASKINELKRSFEHALTAYQREHNAIILSSKPIKGATDRTDYFIDRIRLQHAASHDSVEPEKESATQLSDLKQEVDDLQAAKPTASDLKVSSKQLVDEPVGDNDIKTQQSEQQESVAKEKHLSDEDF